MASSCVNCGCPVYNGHCINCHEETYIAEQNAGNDEPIVFSQEFNDKLDKQAVKAKEIVQEQKQKLKLVKEKLKEINKR